MVSKDAIRKALAILEVFALTFLLVPLLTLGIYALFPAFEAWQVETVGFPFPVFVYVVMVCLVTIVALLRRKPLAEVGLRFTPVRHHLQITGACFIPVVLANLPFGLGLSATSWTGALILAAVQTALLFVLARILRRKAPAEGLALTGAGLILTAGLARAAGTAPGRVGIVFLTYALFVGFGEEILYRGYMQSRLNEVFGKPYRFFGVAYGWGAILTALLFGLTHVGLLRWTLGLSADVTWAWGFWTVFSGLVFGFVREKSGSILAPALLHGLPQAIASAAMLLI